MLGATNSVYSNRKRDAKASKHSRAWQSSLDEANRLQTFANHTHATSPNFTLQRPDGAREEDSDDG